MNLTPQTEAGEVGKFTSRARTWWDPDGPFATLHDINPLRLGYIAERAHLDGARVLDVGCGGGLLAEAMAGRGAYVTAIDLGQANIDAAIEHAREAGVTVDYRCVDVAAVADQSAGGFDVVTCLELLEHVTDPLPIVAACARAVRPGGAVFFSTINRNPKSFVLAIVAAEYLLGMLPRGTHEYEKLIRPAELARWCRAAGLELQDLTGLHFNPLTRSYHLGGNVDVNYLCHTVRPDRP